MPDKKPALVDKLTMLSQVGFVVKDLDKTIERMRETLGAEPAAVLELPHKERKYFGQDADFTARIGFYRFANVELEFIEPGGGQSIWKTHLAEKGEGLHHIRYSVESIDEVSALMGEKGIAISQQGASTREGLSWAYFDTEDALGFIVETFDELKNK